MEAKIIRYPTEEDWLLVMDTAFRTISKVALEYPDTNWKRRILTSEHSPIRNLIFIWQWTEIPSWVSVHITRHNKFTEHFVSTQRNDRQKKYDRNKAPQDIPVSHRVSSNAQAIMDISHKRLCNCASKETREVWQLFLNKLENVALELFQLCVPACIYRNGICPEFNKCGYNKTEAFDAKLSEYKKNFL